MMSKRKLREENERLLVRVNELRKWSTAAERVAAELDEKLRNLRRELSVEKQEHADTEWVYITVLSEKQRDLDAARKRLQEVENKKTDREKIREVAEGIIRVMTDVLKENNDGL